MEGADSLWYWINERHRIFLKKESGEPWPWTDDPILQTYKFTNPFRENDRDTRWMRANWNHPDRPAAEQLFNICFFRMFGSTLFLQAHGWMEQFSPEKTKTLARAIMDTGQKVFTGAYIITNQGLKLPKEEVVVDYFLSPIWRDREALAEQILAGNSLETAHRPLGAYQGWGGGGFMAYEVVTDLNYTLLPDAIDRYTWANAGPGAKRGLNRIHGRPLDFNSKNHDWNQEMRDLLAQAPDQLENHIWNDPVTRPMVDMRMIEHSLCETDKYLRVKTGEGRPRSLYRRPK